MRHRPTPKLTRHARERCEEMGVLTKRVKRIVQKADIVRPSRGALIAVRAEDDVAVVYTMDGEQPIVITVVPKTVEVYAR